MADPTPHQLRSPDEQAPTLSVGALPTGPTISLGSTSDAIFRTGATPSPPIHAGRYQLLEEIGRGGMGVVFRARDPDLERTLALKVLLAEKAGPNLERRFLEEARITGRLQHPGIPPVHEIGRLPDGRPFLAMKLIEGRTLDRMLKERLSTREDLPRFLTVFGQVCQTLGYAHACGIIHRDLKPANVMVGAFGEVQVMDWGLAKTRASGAACGDAGDAAKPQAAEQTQAGSIVGTPAVMAPGEARGEIDALDEPSDVFGLGSILCVILTGQPPFQARDVREVIKQAAAGELEDCHRRLDQCGADAELVALAKQCLAADPARRPAHAGVVAGAIEQYQAGVQERLQQARLERAQAEVQEREHR